jgi:hypothetical protein
MIVLASLLGTPENAEVRVFLAATREAWEAALRERIERGIAEGDVPLGADARRIAAFYTTFLQGLSVRARDGVSAKALETLVDGAMAAWDTLDGSRQRPTARAPVGGGG